MPSIRRRGFALGAVSAGLVRPALAAPSAQAWARWEANDPASPVLVDHSAFAAFLAPIVRPQGDGSTRVAYAAVTPAMRAVLDSYLANLSAVAVDRLARPEQFAFWVNLYNALTLRTVLRAMPVRSIRDINISPSLLNLGLFPSGPWDAKLIAVQSEMLTLNDIEHRILRPIWRDPRVHYAVNCASIGCPDLTAQPFAGATLEDRLDAAARAYVNSPRGVAPAGDGLTLSSIYDWYGSDFGSTVELVGHLRRYARPPLAEALGGSPRIVGYRYDWALNGV